MSLSHQDVQDILRVLDDSDYNELTLETGNYTLHLIRTADGKGWVQETKTGARDKEQGARANGKKSKGFVCICLIVSALSI